MGSENVSLLLIIIIPQIFIIKVNLKKQNKVRTKYVVTKHLTAKNV